MQAARHKYQIKFSLSSCTVNPLVKLLFYYTGVLAWNKLPQLIQIMADMLIKNLETEHIKLSIHCNNRWIINLGIGSYLQQHIAIGNNNFQNNSSEKATIKLNSYIVQYITPVRLTLYSSAELFNRRSYQLFWEAQTRVHGFI